MSPTFWPSPLFNTVFVSLVLGLFSHMAFSQPAPHPPGLIEGLQTLIQTQRENNKKQIQSANRTNTNSSINQETLKSSKLNPEFLKGIFLHTDSKWLNYLKQNDCSFLSLLYNNLIKGENGDIKEVPLITNQGKHLLVSKNEFIKKSLEFKCFNNKQIAELFSKKNVKTTLSKFRYPIPKKKAECDTIMDGWKTNTYLPYLCQITQAISNGRKAELRLNNTKNTNFRLSQRLTPLVRNYQWYTENIDFFKRNYLNNLCHGLETKALFCDPYLAQDVWSKVVNGEHSKEKLFYKCKNLKQKENIDMKALKNCASTMNQSPEICITKTASGYPSLFPRPNCNSLSTALNSSTLKTSYHDCPANIDNLTVVNIHRIINHFKPRKINTDSLNCVGETYYSFNKLNTDSKNSNQWPLHLCYFDKIQGQEVCHTYIPGRLQGKKRLLSEEFIIGSILERTHGMEQNDQCTLTEKKKYNPNLTDYRNGCFIVIDNKKCNSALCPKNIYLDKKLINSITYKRGSYLQYFPVNYAQKALSATSMLENSYKLKFVRLNNLTDLEIFLKKNKSSLIHGIGCAEDLLPQFFQTKAFNQCRPMPFIIDSVVRKNKNRFLVLRTAIDDIHSPRLILWGFVFSSLSNFKKIHSLNLWTLHGIKS